MKKDKTPAFNEGALKTAAAAGELSRDAKLLIGLGESTPESRQALEIAAKAGQVKPKA